MSRYHFVIKALKLITTNCYLTPLHQALHINLSSLFYSPYHKQQNLRISAIINLGEIKKYSK